MWGSTVQIEQLNEENFDTWKLQMGAVLEKNDRWGHVNGSTPRPEDEDEAEAWEKVDRKAHADIILAMNPSELRHVKHCTTSSEVWEKLEEAFRSKRAARKVTLLKLLLFKKMGETDNMTDHLTEFFDTVDRLKEIGVEVSEDVLAILLLYSIPNSYENFRCVIEAKDTLPAPEALKIKLIAEFQVQKGRTRDCQNLQGAFYVKSKGQSQQQSQRKADSKGDNSSNNSNFESRNQQKFHKCYYCQIRGHKAADCWKRKTAKHESASQEKAEALLTTVNRVSNANPDEIQKLKDLERLDNAEEVSIVSAFNAQTISSSECCIDSGAISHMCCITNKFSKMIPVLNKKVCLATNETADIKRKGTLNREVQTPEYKARSEATFRFTVEKFSKMKDAQSSPPCYVRNLPWKIMVIFRATQTQKHQAQRSLGFYLQCNTESNSASWNCYAVAELRLLSNKEGQEPYSRKIQHLFDSKNNDWGFRHFMTLQDVERGYIKDDSITLEVHVVADAPHGVSSDSQ